MQIKYHPYESSLGGPRKRSKPEIIFAIMSRVCFCACCLLSSQPHRREFGGFAAAIDSENAFLKGDLEVHRFVGE